MTERGRYQTKQKEAIAAFFLDRPEACLSAEAVYAALGNGVGMTTVYRAVSRLCEEGYLRRYAPQTAGEPALYQYNPCSEKHMHIRCVECGTLAHLRCDEVHAFASHLLERHGFVLDECQTVLYGLCAACEAARRTADAAGAAPDGTCAACSAQHGAKHPAETGR